jgi:ribosomal protein S18 acetylase RimI-like enzyme
MAEILQDLSPPKLVAAIEASMFGFWIQLGHSPRVELYDGPDMVRFIGDVPSPFCNNVFRAQLAPDDTDARIEATLAPFQALRFPVRWLISPSTRPVDLGKHLEAHGFAQVADLPGMAVDLLALNEELTIPPDVMIKRVADVQTLERWIQAFTIGYGVPVSVGDFFFDCLVSVGFELPWRHYLGWLEGEPVSCSSLLLGAGVAGIFAVATVPEARGRGIGSALTLLPLREARAMGYRVGVLGSTQMGLGVYSGLGFQEFFKFGMYVRNPETTPDE